MKFGLILLSLLSATPSLVYSSKDRDTRLTLCRKESRRSEKLDCQSFVNYNLDKCMDLWVHDFFRSLKSVSAEAVCCAFYSGRQCDGQRLLAAENQKIDYDNSKKERIASVVCSKKCWKSWSQ
ncbi:hypothetical protein BZA77DRAFT_299633 [Pyronema omphalodes]|nr:hypothetical protein BZA77DRAFT_299633 [Pyronema omphalodes]